MDAFLEWASQVSAVGVAVRTLLSVAVFALVLWAMTSDRKGK